MATKFLHEEQVMFDKVLEGFDDMLVIGKGADVWTPPNPQTMVTLGDEFWIPTPMIGYSYDGFDQSSNFDGLTETAVKATIGYHKSVPKTLSAKNLRNARAMEQFGRAAKQKLSSDVNAALFNTAALGGSLFVKRTAAATGFDDLAAADAAMTEVGIAQGDRLAFIAPRDYNNMASNLAARSEATSRSNDAYERARVPGDVSGFDVFKNDQSVRLTAATGGATLINGANQYYTPLAQSTGDGGQKANVDNRYQSIAVDGGTYANIKVGDAFTIAGVFSVNMITKASTGQLQTFRVVSIPAGGTNIMITPPIISATGGTIAEKELQNCSAVPADNAALTWLNTTSAAISPFFKRESLLLIPGSFTVDPQDGWNVMQAETDLGIKITYTRQGAINDLTVKARWDLDFGTCLANPQLAGALMFSQA